MHFITQRNLLSQSYHSTLSNKYEVHTRQYDGRYVRKKGVVKLNKRVTDTHVQKENDGNRRLQTPSWTRLCVGGAYKCLLSPSLRSGCVLSCLAGTESDRRRKQRFRCQVSSGLLAVLQSDLMKRRNVWSAGAPNRPAVSEGVHVSIGGKTTFTPSFVLNSHRLL